MSTNSTIKLIRKDGTETSIYCHWDGYIEHNGVLLQRYYNTPEKIEDLLALGDISSLGSKLNPSTNSHNFDNPERDVTVAYHRDRGEEFSQSSGEQEFNYIFDERKGYWTVIRGAYDEDSEAVKLLSLDYFYGMREELLLDAILKVDVNHLWCEDGTEELARQDCIDKAIEARQPINDEIAREQYAYYCAYAD